MDARQAFIGLGSNLDDPVAQLDRALAALDAGAGIRVAGVSSFYRTEPWGDTAQPAFVNAVARLETALSPEALLDALASIEAAAGRSRARRWGPRTLDLDLLVFDDLRSDDPGLTLPHPRLHERAFVLVPLAELAPALEIPGRGPVRELLAGIADAGVERLIRQPGILEKRGMSTTEARTAPVSVPQLRKMKSEGQRITMLTCYDATFALAMDRAGVDTVLVGDSLGMVVQGHGSTLPVTVDHIVYHSAAVARGLTHALLVADMPFLSYAMPERALDTAHRLMGEGGAAMVKLEGAGPMLESIRVLAERDVPVCAHLGLTPQSVMKLGGFRVQGREEAAARRLRADALAVQEAGAAMLVLECVPRALATEVTRSLDIPVIGIGAGVGCDGQVLVMHDLLGLRGPHRTPRFVKDFLAGTDSIEGAFSAYLQAVREGRFPAQEHGFD